MGVRVFLSSMVCSMWLAAAVAGPAVSAPTLPASQGGETKDRLDDATMQVLVGRPMAWVTKGDLARGEREFASLLARIERRRGPHSLDVADALSAFGVLLYRADHEKQAMVYLRRAVEAYRAALGPDDPEVAVALHDYVNVVLNMAPDEEPPGLIEEIEEALRIRRHALGLDNAETAVTYVLLGRVRGFRANTARDPVRIEEAASLIRTGIDLLPRTPNADETDLATAYFRLAELFARNGRGQEAETAVAIYRQLDLEIEWDEISPFCEKRLDRLTGLLRSHGEATRAEALEVHYRPGCVAGP